MHFPNKKEKTHIKTSSHNNKPVQTLYQLIKWFPTKIFTSDSNMSKGKMYV